MKRLPANVLARYSRFRTDPNKAARYDLGVFAESMAAQGYVGPPILLAVDRARQLAVILNGNHRVAAACLLTPPLDLPVEVTYQDLPEEYPWASDIEDGDRGLFMA